MKCFEAHHRFGNLLDETMILLKDVVEILDLKNFDYLAWASDFQGIVYSPRSNCCPKFNSCADHSAAAFERLLNGAVTLTYGTHERR